MCKQIMVLLSPSFEKVTFALDIVVKKIFKQKNGTFVQTEIVITNTLSTDKMKV